MKKNFNRIFFFCLCVAIIMPLRPVIAGMDSNFLKFSSKAGYGATTAGTTPAIIIANLIKWLLTILGVIFAVLIVYSGYLWLTAGGNDEQVGLAKKRIINAVLGLVLCLTAYAITYMILEGLIGTVQGKF
ncbi:MAG: pilin [bacterium]